MVRTRSARPRRRRIYSNTGIELAAATVADAAGMSFDEYLDEAVLAPLGMTSTERCVARRRSAAGAPLPTWSASSASSAPRD